MMAPHAGSSAGCSATNRRTIWCTSTVCILNRRWCGFRKPVTLGVHAVAAAPYAPKDTAAKALDVWVPPKFGRRLPVVNPLPVRRCVSPEEPDFLPPPVGWFAVPISLRQTSARACGDQALALLGVCVPKDGRPQGCALKAGVSRRGLAIVD